MLSGYQTQVIAFVGDGFIVCRACAVKRSNAIAIERAELGMSNSSGMSPIIRYTAESEFYSEGLYCEDCHTELVEAHPTFLVIESTPGYLPDSEPAEFDEYSDAVAYANELADELEEQGYVTDRSVASRDNFYAISAERDPAQGTLEGVSRDLGRVIEVVRADS